MPFRCSRATSIRSARVGPGGSGKPPKGCRNARQRPGIRNRGATNHHPVAPGFEQHPVGVLRRLHVAVPDQRNRNRLPQLGNEPPVGFALKTLLRKTSMKREHLRPNRLETPRQIWRGEERPVPPRPNLHRNRNPNRLHHRANDPLRQLGIPFVARPPPNRFCIPSAPSIPC